MSDLLPTAEELDRDLHADLELCNNATPEPWVRIPYGGDWKNSVACLRIAHPLDDKECVDWCYRQSEHVVSGWMVKPGNVTFITTSRTGWPIAIRRALAAEECVAELEHRVKDLEVLALWQGGELTEGQAAERLGMDRLSLRGCWLSLAGKSSAQPNQPT